MLQSLNRKIEFARHIPVSKLARRVELAIKRRVRDRLAPRFDRVSEAFRGTNAIWPIFSPRSELAPNVLGSDRIELLFLNQTMSLDLKDIDWRAPGPGSEKQLLRMILHYMEYLEGADDALWTRLTLDWIKHNGLGAAGAWRDSWNSYALSIRVVVWLQELARRGKNLSFETLERVERSILNQVAFLEQNLETDIGGNHLIKNIKALLWAGASFEGTDADRWQRTGLNLLNRELDVQILSDGMHYERSPSYHCQVFADLLECRVVLEENHIRNKLDKTLRKMAQVIADMTHPDGFIAQFNDAGLRMAYAPKECLQAYIQLGFSPVSPTSTFRYDEAGYFGARFDNSFLVLDCGPIAPDDLPAHGHGDVLSFEWSVCGHRVIVDPGVYEYIEGERRMSSRSAASHNTLCLEGADQADFFGAFRCGRRPKVDVLDTDLQSKRLEVSGQHDGFANLPGKPIHQRAFRLDDQSLRVVDTLIGSPDRAAEISFLLHPNVSVRPEGANLVLGISGDEILVSANTTIAVEPAVWWPDMGIEYPTKKLSMRLEAGQARCESKFEIRN